MNEVRNIPKLRFSEFGKEWNENPFKDVSKINQGLQISISERFSEPKEGRYFYITNEFLKTESKKGYFIDNPKKSVRCTAEDVLMTRTGNTGQIVTGVEGAFHNNFFKIKTNPNNIDKRFLVYFLKLFKTQSTIMKFAGTSTIPDLNHSDFYRIKFIYPSLLEQQKIADFLTAVDDRIELLEKKKTLLETYKKGVMKKIFNQEIDKGDSRTPYKKIKIGEQIRFKDENGNDFPDWKVFKLKNVIQHFGGKPLEKYVSNSSKYKIISIGNYSKNGKYIDNGQRVELNQITKTKMLYKNDLVMVLNDKTKSGDIIGSTILIDEDDNYIYNQRSERIVPDNSVVASEYLWCFFNSTKFRKRVFSLSQGGTQIYINFSTLKKIEIEVPTRKEQEKISNFNRKLDNQIILLKSQIEKSKTWKKGLLQKMFV